VSGLGMLAAFALASIGFSQRQGLVDYAGALERASVMIGFTWLSALMAKTLGHQRCSGAGHQPPITGLCQKDC
jgi:hypothetical protein